MRTGARWKPGSSPRSCPDPWGCTFPVFAVASTVVTDAWIDTKVKEVAAKFKSSRNAGPSTFVATAK